MRRAMTRQIEVRLHRQPDEPHRDVSDDVSRNGCMEMRNFDAIRLKSATDDVHQVMNAC